MRLEDRRKAERACFPNPEARGTIFPHTRGHFHFACSFRFRASGPREKGGGGGILELFLGSAILFWATRGPELRTVKRWRSLELLLLAGERRIFLFNRG